MNKVGIVGLEKLNNYGENFLIKCVDFLVKKTEFIETEVFDIEVMSKSFSSNKFIKKITLFLLYRLNNKIFFRELFVLLFRFVYGENLKKNIRNKKAIILALGSFKFKTQFLWIEYSLIVQYAAKKNIPVMFNAMNIQEFDENDWRCLYLKKHLNYSNVKMITTRDGEKGVERLKKYYVTNPKLKVYGVGDVAFCLNEVYQIEKNNSDIIGINLINKNQFITYGKNVSQSQLVNFYVDLISVLNEKKQKWELFTNGMQIDLNILDEILEKLSLSKNDITLRIPNSDINLAHIISSYKIIFGARMHACICAYSMNIPIVGFIWDEKLESFAHCSNVESQFLKDFEIDGKIAAEKILSSINYVYDNDIKEELKIKTRDTIKEFIELIKQW